MRKVDIFMLEHDKLVSQKGEKLSKSAEQKLK
jgi:hypothetical protein